MRGEHAGVVMPVTPRRRKQRGEPVGPVPGESFTGAGGSGAIAQQPFETGAVRGLDQDAGVQREPAAMAPAGEVGGDVGSEGAVELQRAGRLEAEYTVGNAAVQVSVGVERGAEDQSLWSAWRPVTLASGHGRCERLGGRQTRLCVPGRRRQLTIAA